MVIIEMLVYFSLVLILKIKGHFNNSLANENHNIGVGSAFSKYFIISAIIAFVKITQEYQGNLRL